MGFGYPRIYFPLISYSVALADGGITLPNVLSSYLFFFLVARRMEFGELVPFAQN